MKIYMRWIEVSLQLCKAITASIILTGFRISTFNHLCQGAPTQNHEMQQRHPNTPSIKELRTIGREMLSNQVGTPAEVRALEADVLLGSVLKKTLVQLHLNAHEIIDSVTVDAYLRLLARRIESEPVAYLTGEREFWGLSFYVSPAVLIPRPETELLVQEALRFIDGTALQLIDVGVGSGTILLALLHEIRAHYGERALKEIEAIGIDVSDAALAVCRTNAERFGLLESVRLYQGDLLADLQLHTQKRLLIVSNPPYVPDGEVLPDDVACYEPVAALRAGPDGLSVIRELATQMKPYFALGATLLLEIGQGQTAAVSELLRAAGATAVEVRRDLAGIERIVVARGGVA